MTAGDLAGLSHRIRTTAVVLDNGEVLWPFEMAVEAINELARNHRVVLGVDARPQDDQASATEVAISGFEPSGDGADIEHGRIEATAAVSRAETVTGWQRPMILLTWR
jgi:hypothetical protein